MLGKEDQIGYSISNNNYHCRKVIKLAFNNNSEADVDIQITAVAHLCVCFSQIFYE